MGKLASALGIQASFLFSDEDDEENNVTVQKEEIESDLIENLAKSVHSAFSRLK
jgi:hypothetical protein